MASDLDTRIVESRGVSEIYIAAVPDPGDPIEQQARDVFERIHDRLSAMNARILQERVFANADVMSLLSKNRSEVYGILDDGVAPSYLVSETPGSCPVAGIQVYAVAGATEVDVLGLEDAPCGRVVGTADRKCVMLSGITGDADTPPAQQAQILLQKGELVLEQFEADFLSVARTWMWLGDILSWYGDFNTVRTDFFKERGLVGEGTRQSMPASTGIGLGPAGPCACSMDLTAVIEPRGATEYLGALGRQQCALEYGSAFSRASRAVTPAGRTVFVSGTASIDAAGATTNIGDAPAQIQTTIQNVQAVLSDMGLGDQDVVQVVAYSKTTEVEDIFKHMKDHLAWPWVSVVCDVCRDDLLFEIEAAAIADSKKID